MQGFNLTTELLTTQTLNYYNTRITNSTWSAPFEEQQQCLPSPLSSRPSTTIKSKFLDQFFPNSSRNGNNPANMTPGGHFEVLIRTPCRRMEKIISLLTIRNGIFIKLVNADQRCKLTQDPEIPQPLLHLQIHPTEYLAPLFLQPPWHLFEKHCKTLLPMSNEGNGNGSLHRYLHFGIDVSMTLIFQDYSRFQQHPTFFKPLSLPFFDQSIVEASLLLCY